MRVGLFRSLLRGVSQRTMSSQAPLVGVNVDEQSGIATVSLQRAPVNSLNLEIVKELTAAISNLDKNKSRGIILTSAQPTVFSAGLDLTEMYKPNPERLNEFWNSLQELWLVLYGSKAPTVAAINGHSPAGGCLLACSCEYRIMVNKDKKYSIGLNETKLGIVAPPWFMFTFENILPRRLSEMALTTGKLFPVDEAFAVGLVDEVANDKDEAIAKANTWLSQFNKIPPGPRSMTKLLLRSEAIEWMKKNREQDRETFVALASSAPVQKGLELYMAALKKK